MAVEYIVPNWPAPNGVRAVSTTRNGGVSLAPYQELNLAAHVGDDPQAVLQNRRQMAKELALGAQPGWLVQVHGCDVVDLHGGEEGLCADAAITTQPGVVCAVMTADCLPLLVCNRSGTQVAAVHAGWRGLLNGVIETSMEKFDDQADQILVWLGPAIGPGAYQVGCEVREGFVSVSKQDETAFVPCGEAHWWMDIYQIAKNRLQLLGIEQVTGGEYCTWSDPSRFFSYRRDGVTGRMATMIWLEE